MDKYASRKKLAEDTAQQDRSLVIGLTLDQSIMAGEGSLTKVFEQYLQKPKLDTRSVTLESCAEQVWKSRRPM